MVKEANGSWTITQICISFEIVKMSWLHLWTLQAAPIMQIPSLALGMKMGEDSFNCFACLRHILTLKTPWTRKMQKHLWPGPVKPAGNRLHLPRPCQMVGRPTRSDTPMPFTFSMLRSFFMHANFCCETSHKSIEQKVENASSTKNWQSGKCCHAAWICNLLMALSTHSSHPNVLEDPDTGRTFYANVTTGESSRAPNFQETETRHETSRKNM